MGRTPKPLAELLSDIEVWGDRIHGFVAPLTYEAFSTSELHQLAVVKCIEAIGEASGTIRKHYPEFVARFPAIEFEEAYRARDRTIYGYDTIDFKVVWRAAMESVPNLIADIRAVPAEKKS